MGSMNEYELQRDFMYLYERMSEPLGYGIKGSGENMVYYKMPSTEPVSWNFVLIVHSKPFLYAIFIIKGMGDASESTMGQSSQTISVRVPSKMPMEELTV